jgi:hypothetical protein
MISSARCAWITARRWPIRSCALGMQPLEPDGGVTLAAGAIEQVARAVGVGERLGSMASASCAGPVVVASIAATAGTVISGALQRPANKDMATKTSPIGLGADTGQQLGQLGLQQGDLAVELGEDSHHSCHGGPVGLAQQDRSGRCARSAELRNLQLPVDELGSCPHITSAASPTPRRSAHHRWRAPHHIRGLAPPLGSAS